MAHRGKYYQLMFRHDLTPHPDFDFPYFPNRWVWQFDTLFCGGDYLVRYGVVSSPARWTLAGRITWHFHFDNFFLGDRDCDFSWQVLNARGDYRVNFHWFNPGFPNAEHADITFTPPQYFFGFSQPQNPIFTFVENAPDITGTEGFKCAWIPGDDRTISLYGANWGTLPDIQSIRSSGGNFPQ